MMFCIHRELVLFMRNLTTLIWALVLSASVGLAGCNHVTNEIISGPSAGLDVIQSLAPTGKLRVGVYAGSPSSLVLDIKTGERRGVALELGAVLAKRLGVPVEVKQYPRLAEVVVALKNAEIDFSVTNASAARALLVDFSPTLLSVELGYLVRANSPLKTIGDVAVPGMKIGVSQGSSSQAALGQVLSSAVLVPAETLQVAKSYITTGTVDAFATNKGILFELSDQIPGSRVLEGRWGLEHLAIGIPKQRELGLAYIRGFTEEVRRNGMANKIAARAGMRGLVNE
jgi:polar amino acid transport system substrate-binding protein